MVNVCRYTFGYVIDAVCVQQEGSVHTSLMAVVWVTLFLIGYSVSPSRSSTSRKFYVQLRMLMRASAAARRQLARVSVP